MLVYWAAGLTAFFYMMAFPVRVGAAWRSGEKLKVGLVLGPLRFSAHGGVQFMPDGRRIASFTRERSGKTRELNLSDRSLSPSALSAGLFSAFRAARYLLAHITPRRMKIFVRFSFPDAAKTALIYGAFDGALSALRAIRPTLPLNACIRADFRSDRTRADLCGIFSCRLGHIMAATLLWGCDYLARRLHSWIDSRLKAS